MGTELLIGLALAFVVLGPNRMHAMLGHAGKAKAQFDKQAEVSRLSGRRNWSGQKATHNVAYAKDTHADLIGMGVRRAPEITTHFRNTVAYRVVLEAHCPVLTSHSD